MACYYELKGLRFNSEIELDDFIRDRYKYAGELGDIVFDMSIPTATIPTRSTLNNIKREADRVSNQGFSKRKKKIYDSFGNTTYIYERPYVGVNAFLSLYEDEHGKKLFPEFIEDNYWNNRFSEWKTGNFTKDEIELFFDGDDSKIVPIKDNQTKWREKMEHKWEEQCLRGDAIHSVLQMYFSEHSDKTSSTLVYNKDRFTFDDFKNNLKDITYDKKDRSTVKFSELIDDSILKEILDLCKLLELKLQAKFGTTDLTYYPEFKISGKIANGPIDSDTLLGYIDLLVLDDKGIAHIIDYKTSIKPFDEFKAAKRYAYTYQIATYGRLLSKAGLNIEDTNYLITPIQIENFTKTGEDSDGKDVFSFNGVSFSNPDIFDDLTSTINTNSNINRNLDEIIDVPFSLGVTSEQLLQTITKTMNRWFPRYSQFPTYTDEDIRNEIEEGGGFLINEETGLYEFKIKGSQSGKIFIVDPDKYSSSAEAEAEMFKLVKKYKEGLPKYRKHITRQVVNALKEALENGSADGVNFPDSKMNNDPNASTDWFITKMNTYCNKEWEVCDNDNFKDLQDIGIITLFNRTTKQFDFLKVSMQDHKYLHRLAKGENLAGTFKSNIEYESKQDSLMLDAVNGNIEMIETMIALNELKNIFGDNAMIGNIRVVNPVDGFGLSAPNALLDYVFNELCELSPDPDLHNNFRNGKIKLATKAHLVNTEFHTLMNLGDTYNFKDGYSRWKHFNSCKDMLDNAIDGDVDQKIAALEKLSKLLEKTDKNQDLKSIHTNSKDLNQDHVRLYNQIQIAISELKGIHLKQQISDHSKYCQSLLIHKKGLQGSYIDNPGNLSSETLNLLTKLVTQAYQNVRVGMQKPSNTIRNYTRKLMKEKGTTNVKKLYENFYRKSDDDLLFKNINDPSLSSTEQEFLKYALDLINKNRFDGHKTQELLDQMRDSDSVEYYRVPLKLGDSRAFSDPKSLMESFKDKMKSLTPEELLKLASNVLDDRSERMLSNKTELFNLTNIFDYGESGERLEYIQRNGKDKFESDLESILLSHQFMYLKKDAVDEIWPMMKATMIHLAMLGDEQNTKFSDDLQYAEDYIRNKVKNESIIDPKYRKAAVIAGKVRQAASKMVLAFSPVQMLYQSIQSIWNNIALIIEKPDGGKYFTLSNMNSAAKHVYKDLFHFENTPTLTSKLNELYACNDMDINQYAQRLKTDQNTFENLLYKFSSRPDYYSRMTIFEAKMIAEGSLKAHHLDSDGNLVYNWKEDDRFKGFDSGDKTARARYYAMIKQFQNEGTKVIDKETGELRDIRVGDDLPRAYTTQESESMKDLADNIYGYYSSEKKSLIHSTLLGSMWMQFKTYWSGKKNQYLAAGGVHLLGQWKEYVDKDGQPWYYQVNEKGEPLYDEPPTKENTGIPIMKWEGDWKEGILKTISDLGSNILDKKSISEGFNAMWYNEDENLRNAYRHNIKKLVYDLSMFAIVGSVVGVSLENWKDYLEEDIDKESILDGLKMSMANIVIASVKNSFLDFNMFESIGGPSMLWTPFAFEYLGKLLLSVYNTALGDQSFYLLIANSSSLTRSFKPVFKAINNQVKD